jgi:predicted phosphodiesterase
MITALVLGDAYLSQSSTGLDAPFLDYIQQAQPDFIFCTGNLGVPYVLNLLEQNTRTLYTVRGDRDTFQAPERLIVRIHDFTIGVLHGYQLAASIQTSDGAVLIDPVALRLLGADMGVDMLLVGGASSPYIECLEASPTASKPRVIVQPGSVTAAASLTQSAPLPPGRTIRSRMPNDWDQYKGARHETTTDEFCFFPTMVRMEIRQHAADICTLVLDRDSDTGIRFGRMHRVCLFAS